jgi:hypothetical protein
MAFMPVAQVAVPQGIGVALTKRQFYAKLFFFHKEPFIFTDAEKMRLRCKKTCKEACKRCMASPANT